MKRRDGVAMVLVLTMIVLVVPLMMTLSLRSRSSLKLYVKEENQKRAQELASQAMVSAREALANNRAVYDITSFTPDGNGVQLFKTLFWSRGELSQPLYLCAAEGVYLGEERMVVSLIEVLPRDAATPGIPPLGISTPALVMEHDREWLYADDGFVPLTPTQVQLDYKARVAKFNTTIAAESHTDSTSYVNALSGQLSNVDCPDITNPLNPNLVSTLGPSQFQ